MYIYKTEILTVGTKWFSDKADAADIAMLDKLLNERAADGWELVTYDYMATTAGYTARERQRNENSKKP